MDQSKAFKQQNFTSSSGGTYVFQFPGIRAAIRIQDKITDRFGVVNGEKLIDEMLAHVIVQPKMKMEDFDSLGEISEVAEAASNFLFAKGDNRSGALPEASGEAMVSL